MLIIGDNMKNNKGFTLVELLAVIVILAIVLGLGGYVAINAINKAKEKSYQVTINNIEKNASNYLLERSEIDHLFFISDAVGNEHQCVTIKNLIDLGYLKSDITNSKISKDDNVKLNDYVYLERDAITKALVKAIYTNSGENITTCEEAVKATSDIAILVLPKDEWAKERDITITYRLKNLNDINEYSKYTYHYTYDKSHSLVSDEGNTKKLKAIEDGTLKASIKYNEEERGGKEQSIGGIDRVGPVIDLGDYTKGKFENTVTIPLKATDYGIGVDYSSFTKDDLIVKIDTVTISNYTLTHDTNENYTLIINDNEHIGKVTIEIPANKVFDKLENGNSAITLTPDITFEIVHMVNIKYDMNGGALASQHGDNYTSSGSTILYKGSDIVQSFRYDEKLTTNGLANWDSVNYINIKKDGYHAKDGSEWCDGADNCYSDETVYEAKEFCDASESDCTVTLYVNWTPYILTVNLHANGATKDIDGNSVAETFKTYTLNYDGKVDYNWPIDYVPPYGAKLVRSDGYEATNVYHVGSAAATKTIVQDLIKDSGGANVTKVAEELGVLNDLKTKDVTVNLYAGWKKTTCSIKFTNTDFKYKVNNVQYNANVTIDVTCGTSVKIEALVQSCGHKFNWWNGLPTDKVETNPYTFTINSNLTNVRVDDYYDCCEYRTNISQSYCYNICATGDCTASFSGDANSGTCTICKYK